jgi:hypothetical protein
MLLKTWRFVTVVLAALTMAMAFAHLMEMPARMSWDQTLWVGSTVTGGLYKMFGSVGAFINVAALVGLSGLVFLVRKRGALTFRLTLAAALLYIAAMAAWWAFIFPVNQELATWLTQPVPADWADWRRQWETTHALNALLEIVGFCALLLSIVVETPSDRHAAGHQQGFSFR